MTDMIESAAEKVAAPVPPVKSCTKCARVKLLEEFHLRPDGRLGRQSWCKSCQRVDQRRPEVKERKRAYGCRPETRARQRDYQRRSEVKARRKAREQLAAVSERLQAYRHSYHQRKSVRDRRRVFEQTVRRKEWRRAYKRSPKYAAWEKNYRRRPERRSWTRAYEKQKWCRDLRYRLKKVLRARLHGALRGGHKSSHTLDLLGCSVEKLRANLEAQFKTGMTWENYGEWHIDHIRPCASFDLTDPEQQKLCFHYTNLQPLWAVENMSKGAKFGLSPHAPDATVPPCSPPSSPHYASNGNTDPGAICSTEPRGCS